MKMNAHNQVLSAKSAAGRDKKQLQQELLKMSARYDIVDYTASNPQHLSPSFAAGAQQPVPPAKVRVPLPPGLFAGPVSPQLVQRVRQLAENARKS